MIYVSSCSTSSSFRCVAHLCGGNSRELSAMSHETMSIHHVSDSNNFSLVIPTKEESVHRSLINESHQRYDI